VSENRPKALRSAIGYFKKQTYQNKELIVLSRNFDPVYQSIINSFKQENIRYCGLTKSAHLTLGDLRNLSIEKSTGDYWCVWDDDDWHHIRRLEIQMGELLSSKKDAVILSYNLMFDLANKEAYMSQPLNMPGTLLCKKNDLKYPAVNLAEDVHFLRNVYSQNILFPLVRPTLYVYIYHGSNTSESENFKFIFKDSQKLSDDATQSIFEIISNKHSYKKSCEIIDHAKILRELDYCKASEIFR
jgi:glycosyltransferase involved in cell wall biosynthesis